MTQFYERKGEILGAAISFAVDGIPIFPCNRETKRPYTKNGFKDASTNLDQIEEWWKIKWPAAMIGMPTGPASGRWILDIDDKPGKSGTASLDFLQKEFGALPLTLTVRTAGGGRHFYFNAADDKIKNSESYIAPNVDVRGHGGYVIIPPSINLSGAEYKWENGFAIADAPEWLVNLTKARAIYPAHQGSGNGGADTDPHKWSEPIANILAAIDFHGATRDLAMRLLMAGMRDGAVVNMLRGLYAASSAARSGDEYYQSRLAEIPRLVSSARAKLEGRTET